MLHHQGLEKCRNDDSHHILIHFASLDCVGDRWTLENRQWIIINLIRRMWFTRDIMLVHQLDDIMLLGRVEQKADSSLDICVPECREYFPQQRRSMPICLSF